MAIYDGETSRIKVTVTDFNDEPVTSAQVVSATVSLYDTLSNYAFQDEDLTWDATEQYWYYDWQNALPGSWTSVATFTGASFEVFDYGRVRVKPKKVVPTGQPTTIVG